MNTLDSFVAYFSDEKIDGVLKIGSSFFKIDEEQAALIREIKKNSGKDPKYAGKLLGETRRGRFEPSVALLDILGKKTKRKIVIDDNAEWLFLCGRDVFGRSILKADVQTGFVIVQNKTGDTLGFGRITDDLLKKNKAVVDNKLDRGDFLRREL